MQYIAALRIQETLGQRERLGHQLPHKEALCNLIMRFGKAPTPVCPQKRCRHTTPRKGPVRSAKRALRWKPVSSLISSPPLQSTSCWNTPGAVRCSPENVPIHQSALADTPACTEKLTTHVYTHVFRDPRVTNVVKHATGTAYSSPE